MPNGKVSLRGNRYIHSPDIPSWLPQGLIKADDEILWECLIMNSDPDSDGEDDFAFDPDKVAEYRKKMLSAPVENSKAVLEEMIGQRKEEAEDDDMDWDEEILGEMEGGYETVVFQATGIPIII